MLTQSTYSHIELTSNPSFEDILEIFKSSALSAVVTWSESICTITKIKEFRSSILLAHPNIKNFENFLKILKLHKIKFRKSSKRLSIDFSQEENGNYCKKLHRFIDEIENRNKRLFERIRRVQEKLYNVIQVNQKMQKILKLDPHAPESQEILGYCIGL